MRRVARIFLIVVSVLNGLAGLVCGVLLIAKPDGQLLQMGALLPTIETMPLADIFFRDFFWIGVVMIVALGIPNLIAVVMLVRQGKTQYLVTLVAAILLILWCSFELIFMFNAAGVGYFVVGTASVIASALLLRPASVASA